MVEVTLAAEPWPSWILTWIQNKKHRSEFNEKNKTDPDTNSSKNERKMKTLEHTLIISIGWITQVASIPEAPPLTKGLMVGQKPAATGLGFFSSPIVGISEVDERNEAKKTRENEREERVYLIWLKRSEERI